MPIRASTNSNYNRVLSGLRTNLSRLILANEKISTGRDILRPSDDPTGTSRVLSFNRQLATSGRYLDAISQGRSVVDTGAVSLENASGSIAELRQNLLQGLNATLSPSDLDSLGNEMDLLRNALIEIGNSRSGSRNLFGGTVSGGKPWESQLIGGRQRVVYNGNSEDQSIRIGDGVEISVTIPGSSIFSKQDPSGTDYAGLTGLSSGSTADQGSGYEYITVRHDTTTAPTLAGSGLALVAGGANDTLMGDNTLDVDVAAGTVQLGNGQVVQIPDVGTPEYADFTVKNAAGGELHLDFTSFAGADYSGTVRGDGSISIDGGAFTAINLSETDLELAHPESGNVIHVDTTSVTRAGKELVSFSGTVNLFDVVQGISEAMHNEDGLEQGEVAERLNMWIAEVDRNHENVLVALGGLGSRSERLSNTENKLEGVRLQIESLRSNELDADISEAAIELARAQQAMELAQASGVRLLQTNLLQFLR